MSTLICCDLLRSRNIPQARSREQDACLLWESFNTPQLIADLAERLHAMLSVMD